MNKRLLILIMLVAVLVLIAGCEEGKFDPKLAEAAKDIKPDYQVDIGMTEEEFVSRIISSSDDLKTYEFDMDMDISMVTNAQGMEQEVTITSDGSGAIDVTNKKAKVIMDMVQNMPGMESQTLKSEVYFVGNYQYAYNDMTGWIKIPFNEDMFDQQNQIESQIELLRDSEIKVTAIEKVNGVEAYLIEVTPDLKKFGEMMMQAQGGGEDGMFQYDWENMISEYTVKEWIAKDTFFPVKTEQSMKMVMNAETMGLAGMTDGQEFEIVSDTKVSIDITNINGEISIELPADAADAQDYGELMAGAMTEEDFEMMG